MTCSERSFMKWETVLVKPTLLGGLLKWKWLPGVIHVVSSWVPCLVRFGHRIRYRHADHLLRSSANFPKYYESGDIGMGIPVPWHNMPRPDIDANYAGVDHSYSSYWSAGFRRTNSGHFSQPGKKSTETSFVQKKSPEKRLYNPPEEVSWGFNWKVKWHFDYNQYENFN